MNDIANIALVSTVYCRRKDIKANFFPELCVMMDKSGYEYFLIGE